MVSKSVPSGQPLLIPAVVELCADLHGRGLLDATDAELLEAVWQFRRHPPSRRDALCRRYPSGARPIQSISDVPIVFPPLFSPQNQFSVRLADA